MILLHYITLFDCWKSSYYRLAPCHILRVVSIAILIILLIFSTLLTFVFSNNANICENAFINFLLLLSTSIRSSKSSCTDSTRFLKRSKEPSVESLLPFSSLMTCSNLSVTFANNSASAS